MSTLTLVKIANQTEKYFRKNAAQSEMRCTPFVRQYDMLPDEWGAYDAQRGTDPPVSRVHQNFFFFITQRQIKTTRTLMPMTAG